MEYFLWSSSDDESLAWVRDSPEFIAQHPKEYQLVEATSVKQWMKDDLIFVLDIESGIKLSDALPNYGNLMILSKKLKEVLQANSGADLEFYSVKLRDKKHRIIDEPYYLAHLLDKQRCVDMGNSLYQMDSINQTQVDKFGKLVLDQSRLDPGKLIFRLEEAQSTVIVAESLVDLILETHNCYGPYFEYLEHYGEIFRERMRQGREDEDPDCQVYSGVFS
ncbi:Uncharacterised protein [BD1-7 clade bacterium]|uniref:Immunity MXAN-0049 protein domain-containing protein n=1 Tax=BD1-7 clade bacterium TaxID=2029982 RepID=A0A5S9P9B9_9GAMM|nr:Uncharacterised protein [BD1-7 clade bacterium]CAA0101175.1 Uncharacterised protein [BD1-7 clade bacterium]